MGIAGIRHTQAVVVLLLDVEAHNWSSSEPPLHPPFVVPHQSLLVLDSWTAGKLSDSRVVSRLHLGLAELQ